MNHDPQVTGGAFRDVPIQAQASFFSALAGGAGISMTASAAVAALRQIPLPTTEEPGVDVTARVSDVCHGLGLTLTRARTRVDEAAALVETRRPVLLVVRRESGPELVSIQSREDATAEVDVLNSAGRSVTTMPRVEVVANLGISDEQLESVFRIRVMGGAAGDSETSYHGRPLARLWQFLAPDRTEIWIVVGFAIGLGILELATPIAVQSLVNFLAFGGLMQPLIVVGILLLFFLVFAGAIRVFKFYVVEVLQRRVFVRVVSDLSSRLPRVRVDAYDRAHGPELVNRFFDVLTVQKAGSALLIDGLDIALQASIGLLVLGFYHPILLMFDVALIVAIAFILLGLGRGAVATARKESNAKYEVAGALEELARAPVTYKLAGAPEFARARLAGLASRYIASRRGHFGVVLRQLIGAVTLHAIAGTSLLTLGGYLVIEGQLTLGQLIAAELIVSVALVSFVKFGKQLEAFYDLLAGVDKLGVLFDLPTEEDLGESHVPGPQGAALELRDVSYRYPSGSTAIQDFSLTVAPNERVGVRGDRRAGKSTLAELVCGLRDPDSGLVLFDGSDIREVANVSIRSQVDLVMGFEIVQGTVLDNLRLGRSDVSLDEIRDVLSRLGILDELMALPDGLRTEISAAGEPLSRATAELLMLARACVSKQRAIVVDGILDQFDSLSLARSLEVLTDPEAPWSLLVFTTRDEVCQAMDRVVEMAPALTDAGGRSD